MDPEYPYASYGQIIVNVHDFRDIDGLIDELGPWFRDNLPNAQVPMRKYGVGPSNTWKFEVRISGPLEADPDILRRLAARGMDILSESPLVGSYRTNWREQVQKVVPQYDQKRARWAAVSRSDLAAATGGGTFHLLDLVDEPDPDDADLDAFEADREGLKTVLFERLKEAGERATPAVIEKELAGIERLQAARSAIRAVEAVGGHPGQRGQDEGGDEHREEQAPLLRRVAPGQVGHQALQRDVGDPEARLVDQEGAEQQPEGRVHQGPEGARPRRLEQVGRASGLDAHGDRRWCLVLRLQRL